MLRIREVAKILITPLLTAWQLPQLLCGLLFLLVLALAGKIRSYHCTLFEASFFDIIAFHVSSKSYWGLSLGPIVVVGMPCDTVDIDAEARERVEHEMGHSLQSLILGPLYLLVVALPSLFNSLLFVTRKNITLSQYRKKYLECWADALAARFIHPSLRG